MAKKKLYGLNLILVVSVSFFVEISCSKCSKRADCTEGKICCVTDCRAESNCWCLTDKMCHKGESCQHSHCVPTQNSSATVKRCFVDGDCHDRRQNYSLCCRDMRCSTACFTSTSTLTSPSGPNRRLPCRNSRECLDGEHCSNGNCESTSNVMLTKAGFLSAAILTGSIFLLILCCCFVRESRYARQRADRQRRRSRRRSNRGSRRSSHHPRSRSGTTELRSTAIENSAFSLEDCHSCEAGLAIPPPEYSSERTESTAIHDLVEELPPSPPPYSTLSFDLPPTYEEALQTDEPRGSLTEVA